MSQRYKGGVISATPPTTSTSSASGVWTEQQFMQGVASGSWPALAGAPTIGTATAGALSASVTFTAPTYTGSGVTGYTVTSSPGNITGTGASSPVTVSGLTAGTAYTFTVTATTAAGQGPASAASNSVTPAEPVYIEEVYSTYLYTGNGSTQTITNGIDLAGEGGLVWAKRRDSAINHGLWSTTSAGNFLISNATTGNTALATGVTAFSTTGFSLGSGYFNTNAGTYTSWSFKQQAKFFTQVTFTGTGSTQTIAHDLGSTPAFIIVKRTDTTSNWACYHTSLGATQNIALNSTAAAASSSYWDNTSPTSTVFTVGGSFSDVNASGGTYIAYLFAHNAGGFGLTGTDNVISCGSFTGSNVNNVDVTLGYEPQWILWRTSNSADSWKIADNMRGMPIGSGLSSSTANLFPNSSSAETVQNGVSPTATGFTWYANGAVGLSDTYIYIAIRRGPMKVPTSGTSVFSATTNKPTSGLWGATNLVDFALAKWTSGDQYWSAYDRLRGYDPYLQTNSTDAEANYGNSAAFARNADWYTASLFGANIYSGYFFSRAPSYMDVCCYTGAGYPNVLTINHNLGVAPELMIVKSRTQGPTYGLWCVYSATLGASGSLFLNTNASNGGLGSPLWNSTAPTASVFTIGNGTYVNYSASDTYVAYLFATCAGVSKVGSYSGTGATQTINCGFAAGARWVLIKRTDSTGDWYVWDTARGMVSGTDPSLLLNTTAAEVNANSVYTATTGFQIVSTAAGINASGGTYIYLAIA